MVKVKLRKRPCGDGSYFCYVVTLPKSVIEALPDFTITKNVDITIKDNAILIKPKKA